MEDQAAALLPASALSPEDLDSRSSVAAGQDVQGDEGSVPLLATGMALRSAHVAEEPLQVAAQAS